MESTCSRECQSPNVPGKIEPAEGQQSDAMEPTRRRPSRMSAMMAACQKDAILGRKRLYTALILFAFCTMGICFNILSPALRNLAALWNVSTESVTVVYTWRSSGYTIGALVAGFVYAYVNRQLVVSIMLLLMGITLGLVPHLRSSDVAFPLLALNGLTSGFCDTGFNVWMIELWSADSGPLILALWFTFSVGSTVAPLIVGPYLSAETEEASNSTATTTAMPFHDSPSNSSLTTPFLIGGVSIVIAGLLIHIAYWTMRYKHEKSVSLEDDDATGETGSVNNNAIVSRHRDDTLRSLTIDDQGQRITAHQLEKDSLITNARFYLIAVICASTLLITAYSAMEICHFQFLPLYLTAIKLGISDVKASYMSSALGVSHTVVRGVGIFIALKLRPSLFLYVDLALMLVSNCVYLSFSSSSVGMMWLANIMLGVAFGTFFPSIFAYVERLITITDLIGGIFLFSSGVTSAFLPLLIGHVIESAPAILIYSNLVLTSICILSLVALQSYLVKYNQSATQKVPVLG